MRAYWFLFLSWLSIVKSIEISDLKDSLDEYWENRKQGLVDLSDYSQYVDNVLTRAGGGQPNSDSGETFLTDLPDNLKELQQQILEADRVNVTNPGIEVDPTTGWPWYTADIPPNDVYDCIFLFFACSDYEGQGWPENTQFTCQIPR
jgi:hypothetical protein